MKETKFLFDKVQKLYPTFEMPDEVDVMAWTDILDGYSQVDILNALKNYRKSVAYNNAPNPATFKAYLPEKYYSVEEQKIEINTAKGDEAIVRMNEDIANGNCRHNLYVYRDAVDVVLNEWLKEQLPITVFAKFGYYAKLQEAYRRNLFDNFDEALHTACQRRFGRNDEF